MNSYPQICAEVGLDCKTCTENTARNLAKVCESLRGKAIGQMFVQIYNDPACSKMHVHFAEAYMGALGEGLPAIAVKTKKPPQFERRTALPAERPAAMAAMA